MARVAYDAAKSAGRIVRAKSAHDEVIAAVYRAQGHALAIEARAKIRLADEYDAAQERGEVAGHGGDGRKNQQINVGALNVDLPDPDVCFQCGACGEYFDAEVWCCPTKGCGWHDLAHRDVCKDCRDSGIEIDWPVEIVGGWVPRPEWLRPLASKARPPTAADIGLRRDEIFEARQLRDAELAEPGIVERVIAARTAAREEPTKAALREAVSEANNKHVRGTLGTGENEWYTPSEHLCLVREVLGCIDLDPASSEQAQETIRAGRFFTAEQDGLAHQWEGRIFLNPPYAQPLIAQFVGKLCGEVASGRVSEAIMLTHNYTDTAWFHQAAGACDAICFTRGRVRFVSQDGVLASPTQGQAFFYFGENRRVFSRVFSSIGFVVCKTED